MNPCDTPFGAAGEAIAQLPEIDPLQALETNRQLVELLLAQRPSTIRAAREGGASWEIIGSALGISRQGAHDWYSRKSTEPVGVGSAHQTGLRAGSDATRSA